MSGPGVGFEYPRQPVSWVKRDVLLFANTIGATDDELHFLYATNTEPAFKGDTQEVVDFYAAQKAVQIPNVPSFDARRVVDGQRKIVLHKTIPPSSAGKKFEVRTKVLGVYDKGRPGSVVETQTDLVELPSNEVYASVITSSFYIAQGNWGGPKGPATENFPPPKDKKPDATFSQATNKESALLYRLNGDYNPLHATPEPGKKMGFPGAIMHGLYSWNSTAHGLLKALGGSDPANIKEYQARFASPVMPGDKLVTDAWRTGDVKDGWEEVRFQTKVEGGKIVLSNGPVAGTSGSWLGVEWDDTGRGKHDGQHKDVRYFSCFSKAPTAASFVRPTRRADAAQSFVTALHGKYASEAVAKREAEIQQIVFFGKKPAEEVGFDKIRRQLARVEDLTIVILDGTRIQSDVVDGDKTIKETSPLIYELDISRNLFEEFDQVIKICQELDGLKSLRLNGNRFRVIETGETQAFAKVTELELEETLLSWEALCGLARKFPFLETWSCSLNQLTVLPSVSFGSLAATLTTLDLEFNEFTSLSDIAALSSLESLHNLHLKGNSIATISSPSGPIPTFSTSLQYLDISYNAVASWAFVDALPTSFPGLTALRFAHNPIYDHPDPDAAAGDNQTKSTDEAHMVTIGRLASLKALNFTAISPKDRENADMFYLSRIARQLASVPEAAEPEVIAQHARYKELCDLYGAPDVIRRDEINPTYLEARLITVHFTHVAAAAAHPDGGSREEGQEVTKTATIPKSCDVYAVKGIAGRLFGAEPLRLRLVWETGEWDPVGGFDDEENADDSSDEEDATGWSGEGAAGAQEARGGRWVKREPHIPFILVETLERPLESVHVPTMPPKVTNATTFNTAAGNTRKGLSHSIHGPQADDGPQIRPTHFILREGSDSPGAIVPVIPVDLLPDYVTIVGLPRTLTINDTTGMSNLGTFAKPQSHFQLQFVSPAHDRPTGGSPESRDSGRPLEPQRLGPDAAKVGKQSHVTKRGGVTESSKSAASQPTPRIMTDVSLLAPPPLPPRVLDWAEDDTDSVSTDNFSSAELSAPDSSSKSSSGCRDKRKPLRRVPVTAAAAIKERSDADIAERMLELGRIQQQAVARNHHHHPAQALKMAAAAAAAASHSSDGSTRTSPSIAAGTSKPTPPKLTAGKQKVVRPDGSLCRHWCQTGQCSWGNECRYTHQMPLTLEGLADVNMTELPSWWRKQAGLPAEGTIDPRIFAVATVATGLKKSSSSPFPAAVGVSHTAPPPVTLESSRKVARVKPGKAERKMARELRGAQFRVERTQATMSSPVVAIGSKKKLSLGRMQSQTMGIRQIDEVVEKLVDI
ncbi:CAP-Gly domain-containing protein [Colletotrichum limetticola]|uniref:CAP-Gly domain-containing protein n=1 Tax=Colletotrichum limetticola TaxID=1209924 RepID=A0ABQ9Q473_9PEZI|nr:CAP-Gly domain-containing protein [Colletotrichum limetticola]